MLCKIAVDLLVVDDMFLEAGNALKTAIPSLALIYAGDGDRPADCASYESWVAASAPIPDAMAGRDELAGIFYTGGTTGRSKGVMLSHGNLMASALLALAEGGFPRDAVYLHAAPMFHLANGCGMYCMLLNVGTNAIIKAFSPEAVVQAIERFHVSHTLLVPTMIQMLVGRVFPSSSSSSRRRPRKRSCDPMTDSPSCASSNSRVLRWGCSCGRCRFGAPPPLRARPRSTRVYCRGSAACVSCAVPSPPFR